ncbi:hypothetical protein CQ040_11890 [Microbacterium sp. MYb54]|nr:hypothetical protein CQ032_06705 [Microbacterium sp. MYb43]PQZ78406.1 hypothetical protein CQ031_10940 [Microbacterium sp. MYb40]PRB20635.1 hypothetical protein CQ040_11890 [Microbacterium sp. MYb54]PRB28278.1 hypothetical protein CQ037_09265 [Microbacterium sp. MYb50]PRB66658.1 hypothetical protein CQ021_10750 [Microbacterium sp. MYb24]PRB74054.1 hypothetical protein CQ027_11480 [Microbacterium sp. MYb32]
MRAVASEQDRLATDDTDVRPSRTARWVLLTLTLAFNLFATYYYLAMVDVTNPTVLIVGLVILWAVWVALLIVTLVTRPGTRVDRLAISAAAACVVISAALYFLV